MQRCNKMQQNLFGWVTLSVNSGGFAKNRSRFRILWGHPRKMSPGMSFPNMRGSGPRIQILYSPTPSRRLNLFLVTLTYWSAVCLCLPLSLSLSVCLPLSVSLLFARSVACLLLLCLLACFACLLACCWRLVGSLSSRSPTICSVRTEPELSWAESTRPYNRSCSVSVSFNSLTLADTRWKDSTMNTQWYAQRGT